MDTQTGVKKTWPLIAIEDEYLYMPLKRKLRKKDRLNKQIKLYAPCSCGSGKKFKFCCYVSPVK